MLDNITRPQKSTQAGLVDLPLELLTLISQHLPTRDALSLAATNRRYFETLISAAFTRHIRNVAVTGAPNHVWYKRNFCCVAGPYAPFWWAVKKGSSYALRTAQRALSSGAEANARITICGLDTTPLLLAMKNEDEAMVRLLLDYDADPCDFVHGNSPLTLAAFYGDIKTLELLLFSTCHQTRCHGGSPSTAPRLSHVSPRTINRRDGNGDTPLHLAASRGEDKAVRFLLDHGAYIEALDNSQRTSLHKAIYSRQPATVRLLIEAGANPFHYNGNYDSCFQRALTNADSQGPGQNCSAIDILLYLLSLKIWPRTSLGPSGGLKAKSWLVVDDSYAHSVIAPGSGWPSLETLKRLLDGGLPVDSVASNTGLTPLSHYAGLRGRAQAQQRVSFEAKMPIHTLTTSADALLSHAGSKDGDIQPEPPVYDIAKVLLDYGADVDARHIGCSQTPLLRAAQVGNVEVMSLLLSRGADVSRRDDRGVGVLAYAYAGDNAEVLRLLLNHDRQSDGSFNPKIAEQMELLTEQRRTQILAMIGQRWASCSKMFWKDTWC